MSILDKYKHTTWNYTWVFIEVAIGRVSLTFWKKSDRPSRVNLYVDFLFSFKIDFDRIASHLFSGPVRIGLVILIYLKNQIESSSDTNGSKVFLRSGRILPPLNIYHKYKHKIWNYKHHKNIYGHQAFKKWKVLTILTILIDFGVKFFRKNGFNEFFVI
jgi:hypothetical protein